MAKKSTLGGHPYTKLAQLEQRLIDAAMKFEVASQDCRELSVMEPVITAARRVRKWREKLKKAGV